MESLYIHEFIPALIRELSRKRLVAIIAFCISTITILGIGLIWPLKYQTSATLYVDERNIIEPLLEGQAEVQEVNKALEAEEKIYTRQILEKVARDAGLLNDDSDSKKTAAVLAMLGGGATGGKGGIQIENTGKNYIRVSYKDSDPERSFNVITSLINAFIRNIAESKRQESKEAFDFIQGQVEIYKEQLKNAEERLKDFNAQNRDGTERNVSERITELRADIEEIDLNIDEIKSRRNTIQSQLTNEREYLSVRTQADVYREQLIEAESRLQNMLIHLTETHPDVVSLKLQIADHRQAIISIEQQAASPSSSNDESSLALNPLYEELRSSLSETEIALNAATHRKKTLENILNNEYARSQRIASRSAELAELNRDYNVTKNLYEDMLNRKEKARLSMTLDIEGQGTSYKVHEPPTFPLSPSGLDATHFMVLAPIAGILAPIFIVGAFIFLDPRIRLPSELLSIENATLLTITPPAKNISSSYGLRRDNIIGLLLLIVSIAAYLWISLTKIIGVA